MNYLVLDLEFNQSYANKSSTEIEPPRCPFEIIQIGAIKLDENLNTISTFDRLVKPVIYRDLHPFIKEITSITIDQLKTALSFKEVYKNFVKLFKDGDTVLCVWGMADVKELFRNADFHELDTAVIPTGYINLQSYVSQYLCCPKGTNIGLRNAAELLNIPIVMPFHNAFNDAYYTAEIFKRINNENIKPKLYNPSNQRNLSESRSSKRVIDSDALIKQFEKMFDREMNEDERTIIKLAYMMGKTNQFQVTLSNKK